MLSPGHPLTPRPGVPRAFSRAHSVQFGYPWQGPCRRMPGGIAFSLSDRLTRSLHPSSFPAKIRDLQQSVARMRADDRLREIRGNCRARFPGCAALHPGYKRTRTHREKKSMERLKGKTAMVVGAGSIGPGWGNGKATAVTFAREGAQVFCVDRNAAAAQGDRRDHHRRGRQGDRLHRRRLARSRSRGDGGGVPEGLWPHRRARQQCRHCRNGQRRRGERSELGSRLRGQSQERLFRHEARHPRDAEAGRRLDHQHLVDRLDPPSRHFLRHLRRLARRR